MTVANNTSPISMLPEPLGLGKPVVYYNKWTGWNQSGKERTTQYFRQMTPKELRALKAGDLIWLDEEPLHHHGKVYGWVPDQVEKTEIDPKKKTIRVHFAHGFTTVSLDSKQQRSIGCVDDLNALAQYAKEHPLCLNAGY